MFSKIDTKIGDLNVSSQVGFRLNKTFNAIGLYGVRLHFETNSIGFIEFKMDYFMM